MAGCSTSPTTAGYAWSTATGCGTTPKASTTGTPSGPSTPSASSPARRRCGSTHWDAGYRPPYLPGYDTLGTLRHLRTIPEIAKYDHSWFILNQKIIKKEFALSGSEQNPDITGKSRKAVLQERFLNKDATGPVEAFKRHGADFVVANSLEELVEKMNGLTDEPLLDPAAIRRQIEARDLQVANPFCKDVQVQGIRNARRALGDRLGRVAAPHRILDPKAGPLIATKLHILTRKTLGGIQTDLSSRAIGSNGEPIAGLYAAGEVAGFGGGVHGYNALEGTFLGGCIFSGRAAGRAAADAV